MAMLMVLRVVLILGLTLQCTSAPPKPFRRHVDSMFTSEFSRARGAAAIRNFLISALGGKSDTKVRRQANDQGMAASGVLENLNPGCQENFLDKANHGVLDSINSRHQENDQDMALRSMDSLTPSPEFSTLCSSDLNDPRNQVQASQEISVSDWSVKKPGIGQLQDPYFRSVL